MKETKAMAIIEETARKYGFKADGTDATISDVTIRSGKVVSFDVWFKYDLAEYGEKKRAHGTMTFGACIASMGGSPTPDELDAKADEIHRAAGLVRELSEKVKDVTIEFF